MKKKVIATRLTPQGSIITLEDGSEELLEGANVSLSKKDEESQEVKPDTDDENEEMMMDMSKQRMN